jgi:hypothetical protein
VKVLLPAILTFEALVVALAIPVALSVTGRGAAAAWTLATLAVLLLLGAGLVRRPGGVLVGWVLQVLVIATGLLVPAMLGLGLVFLAVWVLAVVYGGKADRIAAARGSRPPTHADGEPPADR